MCSFIVAVTSRLNIFIKIISNSSALSFFGPFLDSRICCELYWPGLIFPKPKCATASHPKWNWVWFIAAAVRYWTANSGTQSRFIRINGKHECDSFKTPSRHTQQTTRETSFARPVYFQSVCVCSATLFIHHGILLRVYARCFHFHILPIKRQSPIGRVIYTISDPPASG